MGRSCETANADSHKHKLGTRGDAQNIRTAQTHQRVHDEFYRGRICPNSRLIPNIPSQVRPTVCLIPACINQSCSPFTVRASEEPIRLAVERKPEKVWQRVIEPAFMLFFHLHSSSHTHTYTHTHTHTFRDTLTCRGQERELPWETEAWVKEGCWQ